MCNHYSFKTEIKHVILAKGKSYSFPWARYAFLCQFKKSHVECQGKKHSCPLKHFHTWSIFCYFWSEPRPCPYQTLHVLFCTSICRESIALDDVIKWNTFPCYWPALCAGIHRSPVNSGHKDQWRGALMFSFICAWINGWINTREAGDLRRYRAHFDVTVMYKTGLRPETMHFLVPSSCTNV